MGPTPCWPFSVEMPFWRRPVLLFASILGAMGFYLGGVGAFWEPFGTNWHHFAPILRLCAPPFLQYRFSSIF